MDFRSAIRARREQLGLSKEALGKQLGCSGVHVGSIEGGSRGPSKKLLAKMEQALGFGDGELLNAWFEERQAQVLGPKIEFEGSWLARRPWPLVLLDAKSVTAIRRAKTGKPEEGLQPSLDLRKPTSPGKNPAVPALVWDPWNAAYGRAAVKIDDDAMAPEIRRNDVVVVDFKLKVTTGRLVLVELDAAATVRRFTHAPAAQILEAFNRIFPPLHLKIEDRDKLLGVVVAVLRNYDEG